MNVAIWDQIESEYKRLAAEKTVEVAPITEGPRCYLCLALYPLIRLDCGHPICTQCRKFFVKERK